MNVVHLIGLTQGAETKTTANGFELLKFKLVTDDEYPTRDGESKTRKETHQVVVWGNLAQLRGDLRDGELVSVTGRIQTRKYQANDGTEKWFTEVVANDLQRLEAPKAKPKPKPAAPAVDEFGDDDIPF